MKPRQPYWKPQHEVFIRSMLKHEDPAKAYLTAYPKAKPASARVGGIRLYGYPHIRQRIEPVLNERRVETHKKALEEGAAREQRENNRRMEMRRVLDKVVMKKLRRQRVFVINGRQLVFEDDPSINTILNAMVLDLRLEAGYNNWPVIERRFARIMASLLPREKREQSVTNSLANSIQTTNSPLEGGRQCAALTGGCRVPRVADKSPHSPTSPRPDAGVANWQASTPFKGGTESREVVEKREPSGSELVNAIKKTNRNEQQTVTICPVNPAPTRTAAYQTASIKKAIVTKATYQQVYPPPRDSRLSSKSV
ncbi:MAG: hypothetical protein K0R82_2935 [Flavipsychrobacter sp.]|nr:hypothetical protein [Flavipsychrobacter sp.]